MKIERAKITVRGAVQGVGFRPFVFRLANELCLCGSVLNFPQGLFVEIEGPRDLLDRFILCFEKEKPPRARIQSMEFCFLEPIGYSQFDILESRYSGDKTAFILPDIATCLDCLADIFDAKNRRHLYPFTNCTNCGPRFSIIESLPYDRANTSMKKFALCSECKHEYHDPRDRRFHAQPTACPRCGPHLELWDNTGNIQALRHEGLCAAADAIRDGRILALKGIGGFQLLVDSRNEKAVHRLRERKNREEKPFALMFPSLEAVKAECGVGAFEERLLQSPEAPIVLLQKLSGVSKSSVAASVAPGSPYVGMMLPYSPLHHIFMRELGFPVVATSGNLGGEPICLDEIEALSRLAGIADLFLIHNRQIVRHVDDSVARIIMDREQIVRRARGYAPLPLEFKSKTPNTNVVLATGAHLKNTVALAVGDQIFLSQHIGDLETEQAHTAFQRTVADFENLYDATPEIVVCDLHPEYLSSKFAHKKNAAILSVQHHYAHVLACAAENEVASPLLGVAWDGTGLGTDGKIWGGEFLLLNDTSFERIAHFREFSLPGGETAVRQPRRAALGLLWELYGETVFDHHALAPLRSFSKGDLGMLCQMLECKVNSPRTSSVGRLFDVVASLLGLRQVISFEGQAAMELEFLVRPGVANVYPFEISFGKPMVIDWEPMILAVLKDLKDLVPVEIISARFHNTLAGIIVEIAKTVGESKIALSGGCFQNKNLLEGSIFKLQAAGFEAWWHQRVPANDGGIALGQAVAALRQIHPDSFPSGCVESEMSRDFSAPSLATS